MGKVRKSGFTLIEMLLVMAILAILIVIVMMAINPVALVGRARDAQRKKDIGRIKVALEEYLSDRGCYPTQVLIDEINVAGNCGSSIFAPWLGKWYCDPDGSPYYIFLDPADAACPKWYKILTNLEYQYDRQIPDGWYEQSARYRAGDGSLSANEVNFGTSSTNVNWFEMALDPSCRWFAYNHLLDECYIMSGGSLGCSGAPDNSCSGGNCYASNDCHISDLCKVSCCGLACM